MTKAPKRRVRDTITHNNAEDNFAAEFGEELYGGQAREAFEHHNENNNKKNKKPSKK